MRTAVHAWGSGAGGAVGIAGCGGTDGRRPGTKDGSGCPAIDLEVLQELVQRNAVLDPVEKLLDRKARPAETGHAAHARGIDPNGFLKLHGTIRVCSGKRLHGRSRSVRCEPRWRGCAWGVPAFNETGALGSVSLWLVQCLAVSPGGEGVPPSIAPSGAPRRQARRALRGMRREDAPDGAHGGPNRPRHTNIPSYMPAGNLPRFRPSPCSGAVRGARQVVRPLRHEDPPAVQQIRAGVHRPRPCCGSRGRGRPPSRRGTVSVCSAAQSRKGERKPRHRVDVQVLRQSRRGAAVHGPTAHPGRKHELAAPANGLRLVQRHERAVRERRPVLALRLHPIRRDHLADLRSISFHLARRASLGRTAHSTMNSSTSRTPALQSACESCRARWWVRRRSTRGRPR